LPWADPQRLSGTENRGDLRRQKPLKHVSELSQGCSIA
jgi:hypothetical protein